jgi:uncharacterized protein YnzC (UPF0291/DUF896 family)
MPLKEVIKRLNELYHKSQQEPLSPDELGERDRLRRIYLDSIKEQFRKTLDRIEIVDETGHKLDRHLVDHHGDGHKH